MARSAFWSTEPGNFWPLELVERRLPPAPCSRIRCRTCFEIFDVRYITNNACFECNDALGDTVYRMDRSQRSNAHTAPSLRISEKVA